MRIIICFFLVCHHLWMSAQPTFPYNGVLPKDVNAYAFIHANIQADPSTLLTDATLVIEKGRVLAVGKDVSIPANAVVFDLQGAYIYPSFIELHSDYGMPKAPSARREWGRPQMESSRKGAFGWNDAIRPEQDAALIFSPSPELATEWRAMGFGAVLTHIQDGIVRGTSALVSLGEDRNESLLIPQVGAHYSFNKGSSTQDYPSSLMGSIALLRQTYYDADWYKKGGQKEEQNLSLQKMNEIQKYPAFFDVQDKWNLFRADKVGDEFGVRYIIRGTGMEYQRIEDVKKSNVSLIIPLQFPQAFDVSDPLLARWIEFSEMKHWEMAPSNPLLLSKAGIPFALTASGLEDKKDFLKNLRKSIERGWSKSEALAALTTVPASMIKTEQMLGQIKQGFIANFFISSEEIFSSNSIIYENWVSGKRFEVNAKEKKTLSAGSYRLNVGSDVFDIKLEQGERPKNTAILVQGDTLRFSVKVSEELNFLQLILTPDSASSRLGVLRFSGVKNTTDWTGQFVRRNGDVESAVFSIIKENKEEKKSDKKETTPETLGSIVYPFTAYGWEKRPEQRTVHFKNATVWTNEKEGIIDSAEVIISGGKIVAVGKNLNASAYKNVEIVDAKGKHLTAGIIDEHSHIALASVNEGSQASSAEVKEGSVVWPEDIDIYRQLSGGVVAAQLLHGSANPIGGQSALIKMRWGANADEMLISNADGFIKFALGENVKQSNWGDFNTTRFPQTRMGVEQVYYDHFIRALEYGEQLKNPKKLVRKDLELDALLEILNKKRFITCHSYVQSEINMLMHVGDSLGFRVNTFTHILEGYKIADQMKAHGAGGSSFSDWWAYKMEVKDAIPHNGALMARKGITVAFNSDDAEMARRLNQEAAKAVKYGGMSPEEALKFVTLNPAKLLHLDDRMGSIKVGKDADIVLWSGDPLSVYSKVEQTYVDGICYFDRQQDFQMRKWMEQERARLAQKMLQAKELGLPVIQPVYRAPKHFHCDTMDQSSVGQFYREK